MKAEEELSQKTNLFKVLGHPLRLKILLSLIKQKEALVTNLVKDLSVSQPTISQHINILKQAGIIEGCRNGNQILYRVKDKLVVKIIKICKLL